jgi:hypothetical protein
VETFLDRGDQKRSRIEKKLDQLRKQKEQIAADLDSDVDRELDEAYGRATRGLTRNETDAAEEQVKRIEAILAKAKGSAGPDWRRKAEGILSWSTFVLDQHGRLLDPPKAMEVRRAVEKLQKALDKGDQADVEARTAELDTATNDLPQSVSILMFLARVAHRAHERGDEVSADRIRTARREFEAAVVAQDYGQADRVLGTIVDLCKEIMGEPGVSTDKAGAIEDRPDVA